MFSYYCTQGLTSRLETPESIWKGANLGSSHCAIRVRGRWHETSLSYKLNLLGSITMWAWWGNRAVCAKEKGGHRVRNDLFNSSSLQFTTQLVYCVSCKCKTVGEERWQKWRGGWTDSSIGELIVFMSARRASVTSPRFAWLLHLEQVEEGRGVWDFALWSEAAMKWFKR